MCIYGISELLNLFKEKSEVFMWFNLFTKKCNCWGGIIQFLIATFVSYWFITLLSCQIENTGFTFVEDFDGDSRHGALSSMLRRIDWERVLYNGMGFRNWRRSNVLRIPVLVLLPGCSPLLAGGFLTWNQGWKIYNKESIYKSGRKEWERGFPIFPLNCIAKDLSSCYEN